MAGFQSPPHARGHDSAFARPLGRNASEDGSPQRGRIDHSLCRSACSWRRPTTQSSMLMGPTSLRVQLVRESQACSLQDLVCRARPPRRLSDQQPTGVAARRLGPHSEPAHVPNTAGRPRPTEQPLHPLCVP
eukprot:11118922-Alexandrium_andersonii.AAC.1